MTGERYYGNYLGIVVQNNDPEKRGRVKVYVPHITAAVYENWNKEFATVKDKLFTFTDKDTNPDLDSILSQLKQMLPWAEQASPLFGGSATGRYNAFTQKGTTSDSNYWDGNSYKEGFRPLQNYVGENRVQDAFTQTGASTNQCVNPNGFQYSPSDYSNLSRGEFTIPNVGAHVWVFFIEGDANYPVVWAASHGEDDWKRIFSLDKEDQELKDFVSTDYPSSFENLASDESNGNIDHNIKTFRSKHVLNSNKHTIEVVDTDLAELLKFTHYSGSFLEFNNSTTSRFASHNDQTLVLGDQFLTVRKNQAIYVANYQENIIMGDRVTKLGDFPARRDLASRVLNILRDTHKYKRLFEIQRTKKNQIHTSELQEMDGDFAKCPVCGGSGKKFDKPCITCDGTGDSPSTQWGDWKDDKYKWDPDALCINEFTGKSGTECGGSSSDYFNRKDYDCTIIEKVIRDNQKKIADLMHESRFGNGGDDIVLITGNRTTNIGTVFNDLESYRVDPIGKIRNEGTAIATKGTYVTMAECPLVEYVDVDSVPGGDWDVVVGNKYRLNVGSKGIHIKTTGPIDMYGTLVNIYGEGMYISASQELLIDGGRHLELRADIINIKPSSAMRKEVLLDGNAGVAGNLMVLGGTHVEGELSYLHATAPKQQYLTETGWGPVAHTHRFFAPPWTLMDKCGDVRDAADALNEHFPAKNEKCHGYWIPG